MSCLFFSLSFFFRLLYTSSNFNKSLHFMACTFIHVRKYRLVFLLRRHANVLKTQYFNSHLRHWNNQNYQAYPVFQFSQSSVVASMWKTPLKAVIYMNFQKETKTQSAIRRFYCERCYLLSLSVITVLNSKLLKNIPCAVYNFINSYTCIICVCVFAKMADFRKYK